MCDQTGIKISALEGSDRIKGIGQNPQSSKIIESSGEDSGFLSGPQTFYSSESLDSHPGVAEEVKHSNIAVPAIDQFTDSGVIGDEDDYTKDSKQESMILPSGTDVGLSEKFYKLDLNYSSQPLNNLSSGRKNAEESNLSKQLQTRPLWEICYVQDADGDTQLHLAILGKYVDAVWAIIRLAPVPEFLDIRNDEVHSPLHLAVLTKQSQIVRWLLLAGANATIVDREGNTPLHLACMNSDKACVNALTLPITQEDLQRYYNFSDRIPKLHYPGLEQRNYNGMHCVHIAAQRNDIDILRHLVALGADINAKEGKSGYTVLHSACEGGNEQLAQFLLQECSLLNVEILSYGQLTAYQLAAEQKNGNLMVNLERYGAELLSPPESDDESYFDSSEDDFQNYESDDCELN